MLALGNFRNHFLHPLNNLLLEKIPPSDDCRVFLLLGRFVCGFCFVLLFFFKVLLNLVHAGLMAEVRYLVSDVITKKLQ